MSFIAFWWQTESTQVGDCKGGEDFGMNSVGERAQKIDRENRDW